MEQSAIRTVLLTGRPGSGKGTQAKRLAAEFGWTHFSTGDLFKALREGEGPIADKVRESYDEGKLLPDWFATYLFEDTVLKLGSDAGIICEGYPRSKTQAETFDSIMAWLDRNYVVLDLDVSDEEVTRRMLLRAESEHRPDSATAEQIAARLAIYHEHTAPVLGYFKERGMLVSIDGTKTPEEVEAAILAALNSSAL